MITVTPLPADMTVDDAPWLAGAVKARLAAQRVAAEVSVLSDGTMRISSEADPLSALRNWAPARPEPFDMLAALETALDPAATTEARQAAKDAVSAERTRRGATTERG